MTELKKKPLFNPEGDPDVRLRRMIGGNTTNLNDFNNMKYAWVSDWYRQAMNNFWIPEEINLSQDVNCLLYTSPNQFAYQILRKLSAGNLVRVSRGALGGCELSCDLDATSLYDLMGVMGERGVLCACMEPGYECRWQDEHGRCAIHCQLTALQRKQDEAFRAVSLRRLLTGGLNSYCCITMF